MKYRIDLHVHSQYSGDNTADPEETIEQAIQRGLHGVVFTEHYSYAASDFAPRLQEKFGQRIRIFRGVEFSAEEGHCLVFGVDTDPLSLKFAPAAEVVQTVNEQGGVVIPSHPYRGVNSVGDLLFRLPGIGGVEGCNGVNMHAMNEKAIAAAGRLNLSYSGGSDAHRPIEVGQCYTEFDEPVTPENFIMLLKAGAFRGVDTRKISRMPFPGQR